MEMPTPMEIRQPPRIPTGVWNALRPTFPQRLSSSSLLSIPIREIQGRHYYRVRSTKPRTPGWSAPSPSRSSPSTSRLTSDLKQRFEREAKTVAGLSHPHICPVFDIGSQDGIDFLVMEYLDGETVAQRLEKGALPLDQALQIAIEIADALDKAHRQGIVHRDLKPANIMLTKAGAKLLDFGLAKLRPVRTVDATDDSAAVTQTEALTAKGALLGTVQYMAPEQVEGKEVDHRADIFAFGAVVYEMVDWAAGFPWRQPGKCCLGDLEGRAAADVRDPADDPFVFGTRREEMPCESS